MLNQRVRITTPDPTGGELRYVGVATALRVDTLSVITGGAVRAIPLGRITLLEVTRGRHAHPLAWALVGAGIGAAAGVAAVGQVGEGSTELGIVVVPLGMALYGGVGALVGLLIRTERWEAIPVEQLRRH